MFDVRLSIAINSPKSQNMSMRQLEFLEEVQKRVERSAFESYGTTRLMIRSPRAS